MSGYSVEVGRDPNYQKQKREFKKLHKFCNNNDCRLYLPFKKRTLDHIIPMWQYEGSPYNQTNWQVLCDKCHKEKTHREGHP